MAMDGCAPFTDALDDYVDGTLDAQARSRVERHLATCPDCRALAQDLAQIHRAARSLESPAPPPRVWTAIAARLSDAEPGARPARAGRVMRMSSPWFTGLAAAAAIVLIVLTASVVRLLERPGGAPGQPAATTAPAQTGAATPASVAGELQQAEAHYQKAIDGLQQIAQAGQSSLDPQVAAALQKNLTVIDRAIAESRTALQANPTSEPAQASLLDAFRTKVGLLEDTIALINEMRKGNGAGAARIVQGLKKS